MGIDDQVTASSFLGQRRCRLGSKQLADCKEALWTKNGRGRGDAKRRDKFAVVLRARMQQ
jgi:hypothetical protein